MRLFGMPFLFLPSSLRICYVACNEKILSGITNILSKYKRIHLDKQHLNYGELFFAHRIYFLPNGVSFSFLEKFIYSFVRTVVHSMNIEYFSIHRTMSDTFLTSANEL